MYVLMDMEWYQKPGKQIPVQIAAIRTNDQYEYLDQFVRRIRPDREMDIKWDQLCFNGGTAQQFKSAQNLLQCFNDLNNWLQKDDIILWWHVNAEQLFRKTHIQLFGQMPGKMGVLQKYVKAHLTNDGKKRNGSPHVLANARGITVLTPEHDAFNDALALFRLLKYTGIPINQYIAEGCMDRERGMTASENITSASPKAVNREKGYYYDSKNHLLHRYDCPLTTSKAGMKYFETIRGCVRQSLNPCRCCRGEMDYYMQSIGRKYPVYKSRTTGTVHLNDCVYISRIKQYHLVGYFNLENALSNNGRLCSCCASIRSFYLREKDDILRYCVSNQLNVSLKEDGIHVISQNEVWRIVMDPFRNQPTLYHHNRFYRGRKPTNSGLSEYHIQNCSWKSIVEYLKYIKNHEKYIIRENKARDNSINCMANTKRGRKAKRANQAYKRSCQINHVMSLLKELEEY